MRKELHTQYYENTCERLERRTQTQTGEEKYGQHKQTTIVIKEGTGHWKGWGGVGEGGIHEALDNETV